MTITLNNLQNDAFPSQSKALEKADKEGNQPKRHYSQLQNLSSTRFATMFI